MKFYGTIGYVKTEDNGKGVWEEVVTERDYYGEWVRNTSSFQSSGNVNDDISISDELSIVADPFAYENAAYLRYAEMMGAKWKITKVEVKYPRLILTIGGVYNGS